MRARILIWIVLACATADAQPLIYNRLPSFGLTPEARIDGVVAYDPFSRQIFLFGGDSGFPRNDLWAFSLDFRSWTPIAASPAPAQRFGHTVVFDSLRRRLIVFGGQAAGFFNDVWAYDIAAGSWRLLASDTGPEKRYGHSGIYDPVRDRMIISHGFTTRGRFDDTWSFDLAANVWRNITPAGPLPVRRCLHHAVHDPDNDQMLLYGGCASGVGTQEGGGCPLGDLWAFDLNTNRWRELKPSNKPPARQWYGLAFDAARRRMVVFGGFWAGSLSDTWEYDPAANTWLPADLAGTQPMPRSRHEGAYVAGLKGVVFFGGRTEEGLSNDLLVLAPVQPNTIPAQRLPSISENGIRDAFSGRPGAASPGKIVSIYGLFLGPRESVVTSYDPATGRLPLNAGGLMVTMNRQPVPLYYASSSQVNAQVPYDLTGQVEVVVHFDSQATAAQLLRLQPTSPGLYPGVFHPDGTPVSADRPAQPSSVVVLFATGQGGTIPPSVAGQAASAPYPEPAAAVSLLVGDKPAEILFRGQAPGTVGVMQVNARLAADTPIGEQVPVLLMVGASISQPGVSIPIR